MIYVLCIAALVAVIGVITHLFNLKSPCDHDWQQVDTKTTCQKCGKTIPGFPLLKDE